VTITWGAGITAVAGTRLVEDEHLKFVTDKDFYSSSLTHPLFANLFSVGKSFQSKTESTPGYLVWR
jgi:hypothetical protein